MLVKSVVWVDMNWIRQKVRRPTMSERRIFLTMGHSHEKHGFVRSRMFEIV